MDKATIKGLIMGAAAAFLGNVAYNAYMARKAASTAS